MDRESQTKRVIRSRVLGVLAAILAILSAYAAWYTYERQVKIAKNEDCNSKSTVTTAPDGSRIPLDTCLIIVIPPDLSNLVRGRMIFGIPERSQVNPYSLKDVLLGSYTFGPTDIGCDQSATTTDCTGLLRGDISSAPQTIYMPNVSTPDTEWTTATDTPVSFLNFSFTLPSGWHGSVYKKDYAGGWHLLAQKAPDEPGFVIDCPPDGKGLEAATRLSSVERSFSTGTTTYSIAFEKWTAPENEPWLFVWLRTNGTNVNNAARTACLAQGSVTPDIEEAMRMLYETWK